jgi:signal transduction histidine kinase
MGTATVDEPGHGEFLTVTANLTTASHSAPVIAVLAYPLTEAFAAYRAVVLPVLLVLAGALLLAAISAMLVVRSASRPLEALAGTARRIAAGDYTPPPQMRTKDEIGTLSDALIGMTSSIADREAALNAMIGALEAARSDAVKANEAKSQFLANMSHELRTPLNAIVGFGDMLHHEILGPLGVARYREYAADISASGQRLLGLVSRMLDLADVDARRLTIERRRVAPGDLLHEIVAGLRSIAGNAKVQLSFDPQAALPDIEGDAVKLRQAFTSILHNAVKFTPPGGEVRVCAHREGDEVLVRISDTGVGMTEADVEVVTRPFHRLRSALDGQHQGAGLGLPYAKAIVELHGGRLTIRSVLGAGTNVEIHLPASLAAMGQAA